MFVLWLVDGASNMDPDFEWIGRFTPSDYYSETEILVHEEFAYADAGLLLTVFVVLVVVAVVIFQRRDI